MSQASKETKQYSVSFDVGLKHLAMAVVCVHADKSFEIPVWTVETCVPKECNVNKSSINDLAPMFYKHIQALFSNWSNTYAVSVSDIQTVYIEMQPMGRQGSARNLKTKILSHLLQCVSLHHWPKAQVQFIHPNLKLKDRIWTNTTNKPTYYDNKQYAISKTTELISSSLCRNQEACKAVFCPVKRKGFKQIKKDDFADAFLQGYYATLYSYTEESAVQLDKESLKPKKAKSTTKKQKRSIVLLE